MVYQYSSAGSNKDDANTTLGIYYKFNEGIYNTDTINRFDSTVLDYSGRISNGTWVGYSVRCKKYSVQLLLSQARQFQNF